MFTISCPPKVIWLGRKGENEFRTIEVEASEWLRDYPNGTVSVVYHRPDGAIYLPTVTTSGNVTSWLVTATDTAMAGKGEVEYRIIDGDVIGKSVKMPTMVSAAINATTDSPEPPPEDWTAVAADLQRQIGDLDGLETEDKSSLVAAINEAAQSGGGGSFNIHALTAENNIADADETPFYDFSANAQRKTTWANIKAKLKAYFDTLYIGASSLVGYATQAWVQSQGYGTYSKPSGGIPKTDLASGVQTSLSKADTALQQHQSLAGYATESYVQNYHDSTKQDVITDLASIRSGAALGATAVQPEAGKGLFSGNYNDLSNKPALFSGNYNDLTNKPTIPTVNDAVLTIKQGGVTKGTFSANASSATEINLDAGGGGAGGIFTVNITHDGDTYSSDKTTAEILAAKNLGQLPVLYDDNVKYDLQTVDSTHAYFDRYEYDEGYLTYSSFSIRSQGAVSHFSEFKSLITSAERDTWNAKQPTTITDTAGYFTTDTVEGALAEIGGTLDGLEDAINTIRGVS